MQPCETETKAKTTVQKEKLKHPGSRLHPTTKFLCKSEFKSVSASQAGPYIQQLVVVKEFVYSEELVIIKEKPRGSPTASKSLVSESKDSTGTSLFLHYAPENYSLTLKSLGKTSVGCPRTTNKRELSFLKLLSRSSRDWRRKLQRRNNSSQCQSVRLQLKDK